MYVRVHGHTVLIYEEKKSCTQLLSNVPISCTSNLFKGECVCVLYIKATYLDKNKSLRKKKKKQHPHDTHTRFPLLESFFPF